MNCEFLNEIEGLQFIPIRKDKSPIPNGWQNTKKKYNLSNVEGVGLVCGELSGNIEVIDIDLKYDLTGTLFADFKKAINDIDSGILKKLVVQKTMSGGYHFIYRCSVMDGNKKLANRPTTKSEKDATYNSSLAKFIADGNVKKVEDFDAWTIEMATKASENDKIRVLLETRGLGGQIACYPMKGYELVYGDFNKIQELSPEEKSTIFNVAYTFNQVLNEPFHDRKLERKRIKGKTPSEDYNERGDVQELLENHGWTKVGRKGSKIMFRRPGDTKADHSGNFDEEKNWFSVFSTSTEFQSQTPYQPYAVFAILECGGDFSLVPERLREAGYGDSEEVTKSNVVEIPSKIDMTSLDNPYLAKKVDYDNYLHKWRTNTFEKGKGLGCPTIDDFFLFKEADFVAVNGIDNVGKSTLIWYLATLSSMYHNWKWLIYSSENKVGGIIRKMIEFYWCEAIESMNDVKYKEAKAWVENNFDFIKNTDKLYNYTEILDITTKSMLTKKYHGLLIDPYNSLKVDISTKNKATHYEYHYETASNLKLYGGNNNLSIYVNTHANTNAARKKNNDSGFTMAPQKEDSEMGVIFANKCDEFLTIHRNTQSEKEFMFTELHVRKVKETETGGRVTPLYAPIYLQAHIGTVGFDIKASKDLTTGGFNPVREWHKMKKEQSQGDIFKGIIKEEPDLNSYIIPINTDQDLTEPPF